MEFIYHLVTFSCLVCKQSDSGKRSCRENEKSLTLAVEERADGKTREDTLSERRGRKKDGIIFNNLWCEQPVGNMEDSQGENW